MGLIKETKTKLFQKEKSFKANLPMTELPFFFFPLFFFAFFPFFVFFDEYH
jgi:hypothetical protein